jgi:hypothetical protein
MKGLAGSHVLDSQSIADEEGAWNGLVEVQNPRSQNCQCLLPSQGNERLRRPHYFLTDMPTSKP